MSHSRRAGLTLATCVLVAVICLAAGLLLGSSSLGRELVRAVLPSSVAQRWVGTEAEFPLQSDVLRRVERTYYKPVDRSALEESAIRGMLAGLGDPYTAYFDPDEYAELKLLTEGSYSGVGIVVEMRAGYVTVVSTFKDSPAELGGVMPGDIILQVDDESIQGLPLERVVARIKGPEGTGVRLRLYRLPPGSALPESESDQGPVELPAGGETIDLVLQRQQITPPVLESALVEDASLTLAHIRFFTFSEGSADKLRQAVQEMTQVRKVDGIVLDLRSNGGGLVDEAVKVAGIFLERGSTVATVEGLHTPREVLVTTEQGFTDIPLWVVTDEYTASASEIVAGALKDNGRATIVGTKTFGKGLIQSIQALRNGGAVKITSAVYLTPSGADINGKGVEPDILAKDDPATRDVDEALQAALADARQH